MIIPIASNGIQCQHNDVYLGGEIRMEQSIYIQVYSHISNIKKIASFQSFWKTKQTLKFSNNIRMSLNKKRTYANHCHQSTRPRNAGHIRQQRFRVCSQLGVRWRTQAKQALKASPDRQVGCRVTPSVDDALYRFQCAQILGHWAYPV